MKRTPTNEYLRTKVLTASPAELRLMLLDGAVRFAEQAKQGIIERDYERMYEGITRAQAILVELLGGLDPTQDAELCKRLSGLYTYMYTRLVAASSQRDHTIVEEVCKLLSYERETWQLLMAKLAGENAITSSDADANPASSAENQQAVTTGSRLSLQG